MNKSAIREDKHRPWDIYKLPPSTPELKWAVELTDGTHSVFRTKKQAEGFVAM